MDESSVGGTSSGRIEIETTSDPGVPSLVDMIIGENQRREAVKKLQQESYAYVDVNGPK